MRVGRYQLHALVDARFRLDGGSMFGVVPRALWARQHPPDEANRISLAARCLLLVDDRRRVLIDTGLGDRWSAGERDRYALSRDHGGVPAALSALGLGVADITDVVQTHLHFDHAGGLCRAGDDHGIEPTFPNATLHVQRRHWDWARAPSPRDAGSFRADDWAPYTDARAPLALVDGAAELLPGIEALPSDGHTVGHQSLRIRGDRGGPDAIYLGDLVPTAAHLPLPWTMAYDLQPLVLLEDKQRVLHEAVERGHWLIFEHDPVEVAVRVRAGARGSQIAARHDLAAPPGERP